VDLAKHISDLLFTTDRVVVPGLGVFSTKYIPASIHSAKLTFQPPSKEILFTSAIKDDNGLLIRHIAKKEGIKEEIAKEELEKYVKQYNNNLSEGKKLKFINLGTLSINPDGTYVFKADKSINYLDDAFGMEEIKVPESIKQEEKKKAAPKPKRKKSTGKGIQNKRIWIVSILIPIAAIIVLGIFNSELIIEKWDTVFDIPEVVKADETTEYPETKTDELSETISIDSTRRDDTVVAKDVVKDTLQSRKADVPVEAEKETPEKETVKKVNVKRYYIVAGSFRSDKNAEKLVEKLESKGYNPEIFGTTSKGLQMVSYESFENKNDASIALRKIMREENSGAWIIRY